MFRNSALPHMLEEGERIEADQGYIGGDPEYFVTPNGMGPGRQAEKRLQEKKLLYPTG